MGLRVPNKARRKRLRIESACDRLKVFIAELVTTWLLLGRFVLVVHLDISLD